MNIKKYLKSKIIFWLINDENFEIRIYNLMQSVFVDCIIDEIECIVSGTPGKKTKKNIIDAFCNIASGTLKNTIKHIIIEREKELREKGEI